MTKSREASLWRQIAALWKAHAAEWGKMADDVKHSGRPELFGEMMDRSKLYRLKSKAAEAKAEVLEASK